MSNKNAFNAKTKFVDLHDGEDLTALLNEEQAREYGIRAMDKVSLFYNGEEIVLDVNLTHKYVDHNEVGITKDVREKYGIPAGEKVSIRYTSTTATAVDALRKAIQ